MSSPPIPPELNQPLPRHVTANGYFKFSVAVLTFFLLLPPLIMLPVTYGISHNRALLRTNGVPAIGQITDLKAERSRSTYVYRVSYRFQPSSVPGSRQGFQTGTDGVSEARYRNLHVGQDVPILYEPSRPGNSGLHFDDSVNTSDDSAMMLLFGLFIVGLSGGLYVLLMAVLLVPYFREKKLLQWSHVASAVILEEEEIGWSFRPTMTATYQFTDEKGQTVTATQKNLPSVKKLNWPGFRAFREAVTKNPVAVYQPENSEKSMLYRAGSLVCYVP